jgi:pimeloyl-ACP methyl ester carboxylesterase
MLYSDHTIQNCQSGWCQYIYRQAENTKKPTILLLHGFPFSSHMFRNLIKELADEYNIIAPDYPGFGNSDQPPINEFEYTGGKK